MANMYALMYVDRLLQDIMGNAIPFGSKAIQKSWVETFVKSYL